MKTAFILGPTGKQYQETYYDKFEIKATRPWLLNVPRKYHIDDNGNTMNKSSKGPRFVRIDYAVGYCLQYILPNADITLVHADTISNKEFKKYDFIINQYLDLLIVPFIKQFEKKGIPHEGLREIYEKHALKLYPPAPYANLIYNKCSYYAFLKRRGFPVAPTVCITRDQYLSKRRGVHINALVQTAFTRKWGKIFSKPVHGTDGIDTKIHAYDYHIRTHTLDRVKTDIKSHLDYMFKNPRYPAVVFQKFIQNFEKKTPQVRMYYVGNEFIYSVLTDSKGTTSRPQSEGGSTLFEMKKYKLIAARLMRVFDTVFFKKTPKLVTRIDFACCVDKGAIFINEIEFNPGMYLHLDGPEKFSMDQRIATQLVEVINTKIGKKKHLKN
jgi:hypothetical protein